MGIQWSLEQIACKVAVSHDCVYLHVYANTTAGGDLNKNLRSQKSQLKRHRSGRDRRAQTPIRRLISERPSHIEERKQVGHWEGDAVIGVAHKKAIVTLVERKSCFAVLAKVSNMTAHLVGCAIEAKLKPLNSLGKTLTVDNSKEFVDQYCSWQRGNNENFNGLLRQYIPKKRCMENVTDE